jgi:hypothetical protein
MIDAVSPAANEDIKIAMRYGRHRGVRGAAEQSRRAASG